jgi:hypothetical protein
MPAVISPVAGTRVEPTDSYKFVRGTTATFKIIFTNNGIPTTVDAATIPVARVFQPVFLNLNSSPVPQQIAAINGTLVAGQTFEYEFVWDVPSNQFASDEYVISYEGVVGSTTYFLGDEYFSILSQAGQIGIKSPSYATVDDVRQKKFNIDDYLPPSTRSDLTARNNIIEGHLRDATKRLREELNLTKSRGNSDNYRLFCIYYTIYTILLASRGEDGSSVSDQNLIFWRTEWERILSQEKREGVLQGIPMGRG